MKNLVDERFELAALIFRLAGREEYCELKTEYQRETAENFAKFAGHPAVKLIKSFDGSNGVWVGYHCTLEFTVYIEKKDGKFVFIKDIGSLGNGWTETAAKDFLPLFNDFYNDTNYSECFNSHIPYFEEVTQKFVDTWYDNINFEWFRKYVDPSDLRCIVSPSTSDHNYAATVNNKIIYCLVCEIGAAMIHEYCHSFGTPLGLKWYDENPKFKKMCDDSVDLEKRPYYSNGLSMASEYVTNAYSALYIAENKNDIIIEDELANSYGIYKLSDFYSFDFLKQKGFPYIEEVYEMVLSYEKQDIHLYK